MDIIAEIEQLKADNKRLRVTLGTFIAWVAQSAGSPISRSEAETLLNDLREDQ